MGHGYFRVVRAFLFLAVLLGSTAVQPTPTAAQYMYLDANGDGVHTDADVVPVSGTVTFDVWLVTDRNRDGSAATCAQSPGTSLNLRSYSFVLLVFNGRIQFSTPVNRVASFTLPPLGSVMSQELSFFAEGAAALPAGRYRLASVSGQTTLGTPRLSFAPGSSSTPFLVTGFGSDCPGAGYTGSVEFTLDWADADGLPYGGQENRVPTIATIAPMTVAEGSVATQVLGASDLDGDPIQLTRTSGPPYMSFAPLTSTAGSATAEIRLTPGYSAAGSSLATFEATDEILTSGPSTLEITVTNTNRPPSLGQPDDMLVEAGTREEQDLALNDPDGDTRVVVVSGPWFVGVVPPARFVADPPPTTPASEYVVTLRATDGAAFDEKSLRVTVYGTKHPPTLEPVADMVVVVGESAAQDLRATDPDVEIITVQQLDIIPFVRVDETYRREGLELARLLATPDASHAGVWSGSIRATDGILVDDREFGITVLSAYPGSRKLLLRSDPKAYFTPWDELQFNGQEGSFTASGNAGDGVTVVFDTPDPSGYQPAYGPWIELACTPAIRPQCMSDQTNTWSLTFAPPAGQSLMPGLYQGATALGGPSLPRLFVRPYCPNIGDCGVSNSTFEVREATYDAQGKVETFWATFEQRCANWSWVLAGEVRFNARLPVFAIAPSRVKGTVGLPVSLEIRLRGSAAVLGTVTSPNLPDGATFLPRNGEMIPFSWTPLAEQVGLHRIDFVAAAPGERADTTHATVCIDSAGTTNSIREGEPEPGGPELLRLAGLQASIHPNPFNPDTKLTFTTSATGFARVTMFDLHGRKILQLLDERALPAGPHSVSVGRALSARRIASGIYFYRLETREETVSGRLVILR
ncbi:MAG: T9SS type A sorting domain-containing protein [Candidatus Eisenbacteria bacterium]